MKRFGFLASIFGVIMMAGVLHAGQFGVEGVLGKPSLGVVYYEQGYAGGLFLGQDQNDLPTLQTSATTYGLWGGLREKIDEKLFFTYGFRTYLRKGVAKSTTVETFGLAPFVGFDYHATSHFLLKAWTHVFDYNNTKSDAMNGLGNGTATAWFQSYAGVSYLF